MSARLALCARLSALVAAACLWACDFPGAPRDTLLSLKLDDSLSAYDSIRVDILYPGGKPYKEAVFSGPYAPGPDHALHDLDLGAGAPSRYQVLITAYRDAAMALVYSVQVGPGGAQAPQVLVRSDPGSGPPGPGETPPLRVALLTPSPLELAAGGQATQARAEVQPLGADPGLIWSSSDTAVVGVDAGGMLFPGAQGEADITARSRRDPALSAVLHVKVSATVKARGLALAPNQALLYVGGPPLRLDARATPAEAQASIVFVSRAPAVAQVSQAGVVTAVAPGSAEVVAFPAGDPSLMLTCRVTVKRDAPVLEIGSDRTARPGDTLLFPVKATQEYGTLAVLKWDLDGDGIWEDSTDQATAAPRHVYDGRDSLLTAIFYARDGEGNSAQAFVFVRVGAATALPPPAFAAGTTASPTADPRPTWAWIGAPGGIGRFRFSLDGGPERETRATSFTADSLADGAHALALRELDAFGSSSPTVSRVIRVATAGPKVSILNPTDGFLTNAAFLDVSWTEQGPGGALIAHTDPEDLSGRQGAIAIVRAALDPLGHRGADTVLVIRDTVAPASPSFTDATSPDLVNGDYAGPVQWAWTRGGDADDRFLIRLDGAAAIAQAGTTFILDAPQNQVYVLEVREADAAGNASPPIRRAIAVDRLAPPPPAVSGAYGAGPAWNWSPAPGSDGARMFRYRLSTQTAWSQASASVTYAPAGLPPGTYTLQVEERDAAGNWSAPGSSTLTGP